MRRIVVGLVAVVVLACVVAYMAPASGQADGEAAPIYGVKIPPGYRDWKLISVAREEGNLNDIRAQQRYSDEGLSGRKASRMAPSLWRCIGIASHRRKQQVFGRAQSWCHPGSF